MSISHPMVYTRRRLSLMALALPFVAGACATSDVQNAERILKIVVKNARTLGNGFKNVAAQLASLNIPGLTPQVWAIVNTSIDGVIKVAGELEGVTSIAGAKPLVEKLSIYVQTVVNSLATLPLPDGVVTALRAASIILPIIEMAVDMAITNLDIKTETSMSVEQAERILLANG